MTCLAIGLAAVTASCASGATSGDSVTPTQTSARPSATTTFTTSPLTPSPQTPSPTTPSPQGVERTLTGTLEEGVEVGCLLLVTDDGQFLLLGEPARALSTAGAGTVTVTGTEQPDLMTTCQQGTPFVVASVVSSSAP